MQELKSGDLDASESIMPIDAAFEFIAFECLE